MEIRRGVSAVEVDVGGIAETVEWHGTSGTFGRVTYFLTSISLQDVAEQLHLLEQKTLRFEERIQRLLDEKRVEEQILPYLDGGAQQLKFFNSLVVVPLPHEQGSAYWDIEAATSGGVKLAKWAKLRVQRDCNRVVVDGQHRREALRLLHERWKEAGHPKEIIEVPVCFLFFDDMGRVGGSATERPSLISSTRQLFRDLNLTARKMDQFTGLLIDDTNLPGVMARSFLSDDIGGLELWTKWSSASNLTSAEACVTTLTVLVDAFKTLLTDHTDAMVKDYYDKSERDKAMADLYDADLLLTGVKTKELLAALLTEPQVFQDWRKRVPDLSLTVPAQPADTLTPAGPKAALDNLRQLRLANVLYTVAGQKALISACYDYLANLGGAPGRSDLTDLVQKLDKLYQDGFFDRIDSSGTANRIWVNSILSEVNGMQHQNTRVKAAALIMNAALDGPAKKSLAADLDRLGVPGYTLKKTLKARSPIFQSVSPPSVTETIAPATSATDEGQSAAEAQADAEAKAEDAAVLSE